MEVSASIYFQIPKFPLQVQINFHVRVNQLFGKKKSQGIYLRMRLTIIQTICAWKKFTARSFLLSKRASTKYYCRRS